MASPTEHIEHRDNIDVTTNATGGREDGAGFDMNKRNLIWDPLRRAFNQLRMTPLSRCALVITHKSAAAPGDP